MGAIHLQKERSKIVNSLRVQDALAWEDFMEFVGNKETATFEDVAEFICRCDSVLLVDFISALHSVRILSDFELGGIHGLAMLSPKWFLQAIGLTFQVEYVQEPVVVLDEYFADSYCKMYEDGITRFGQSAENVPTAVDSMLLSIAVFPYLLAKRCVEYIIACQEDEEGLGFSEEELKERSEVYFSRSVLLLRTLVQNIMLDKHSKEKEEKKK